MKSKFLAALVIACAGLFAGLFAGVAAPASASCAPGFTSIPCTIADNIGQAPATTIGALTAAPGTLLGQGCDQPTNGNPSGNDSNCGLPSITNLAGVGCPPGGANSAGVSPSGEPCGLPAAPGQFADAIAGLPGQAAVGVNQIVTAPQTIAGALAAAPGQFVSAIQNGGTAPETP
ncbi:hypothetical protein [Mycobacterium antarcticum]|uniref:hypothetical protein n=1 Tax=Mycolicibacterium sp. TUM20984 TaxID=3023368 RepID=UPI00238972BB|nr:hypothetical protein [Mycolicibacterium sp. TUM20984]GLP82013.1 hypothetical protein TUM20984_34330 [Mycolicibacterium sp. TUM20984]